MIITATAASSAYDSGGSGPQIAQIVNEQAATRITIGTNKPATLSAYRWMGARLRCVFSTISTIWLSTVSVPTRVASMIRLPVPLMVAPVSESPGVFSTGIGSPVIIL